MYIEIKTERLLLRPLGIRDLHTAHAYASDAAHTRYMIHLPNRTLAETQKFLEWAESEWSKDKPEDFEFAIMLGENHIGAVSLSVDKQSNIGELGWILHQKYLKRGYAVEAALALKAYAVNTLKISKLIAHCDRQNENSEKLMRKIGLQKENIIGTRQYPDERGMGEELTYSLVIRD